MNLKQLADILSLSQTTVSRALNGYPEVAEETRRRVIAAAKRYGYRPNPSARRLATGKAGMIGYVMPTGASVEIDPHFIEFLSGLGEYARTHELDLALSPTLVEEEETTYRRVVANKQVDAVYVSAPRPQDSRIRLLEQNNFPYIVHGRSEGLQFEYPFVDIDNDGAFHDAARLMVQFGHMLDTPFDGRDEPHVHPARHAARRVHAAAANNDRAAGAGHAADRVGHPAVELVLVKIRHLTDGK